MRAVTTTLFAVLFIFSATAFAGVGEESAQERSKELDQILKKRYIANMCKRMGTVVSKAGLNPGEFSCSVGEDGVPYIYSKTQSCALVPGTDPNNPDKEVPANDTVYCEKR